MADVQAWAEALARYSYPPAAVRRDWTDFQFGSVRDLEESLRGLLSSALAADVRHGYVNVVFWGFASGADGQSTIPRARARAQKAHEASNDAGIADVVSKVRTALAAGDICWAVEQADALPQIGFSFATKICAFLDPEQCGVLDSVVARNALDKLQLKGTPRFSGKTSVISSNANNYSFYQEYCSALVEWAKKLNRAGSSLPRWRAVDVERALYVLSS